MPLPLARQSSLMPPGAEKAEQYTQRSSAMRPVAESRGQRRAGNYAPINADAARPNVASPVRMSRI